MKKLVLTLIAFVLVANLSAQVEVKSTGVGIGTTNPQYPLDVNGNVRVSGDLFLGESTNQISVSSGYGITFMMNNNTLGHTGISPNSNVSFGYQALNGQSGGANVAFGSQALFSNTFGSCNTAVGTQALFSNTTGTYNTAVGYNALGKNTTGMNNTAVGHWTLYNNISGHSNTAIGFFALHYNTTGTTNTAMGHFSLINNTTGSLNTAIGSEALNGNTTGGANTAIGAHALNANTVGSFNTAIGYGALRYNYLGNDNTAIGFGALSFNSTGNENTAISQDVLHRNTTGSQNIGIGSGALSKNTTGNQNIAIGNGALSQNTGGNLNIAIGLNAHMSNVSGHQNIFIGDFIYGSINYLTNVISIGSCVYTTSSNQVRIGNSSMTSIGGQVAWSTLSDDRAKRNIEANVPGLAFIKKLQPVTYNLDLDAIDALFQKDQMSVPDSLMRPKPQELIDINNKARKDKEKQVQTGFVAQDVENVAKRLGYDFSGVEVDEVGIYSLRYGEFVVPLVKAVQELSEQNDRLQKQVDELTLLVNKLLETK